MSFMSPGILNHTIKTTSRLYLSTRPREIKSIRFMHRIFSNLGQKMITPVPSTQVITRPFRVLARDIKLPEDNFHLKFSIEMCTGVDGEKKCSADHPNPQACHLGKTPEECRQSDIGEFTPGHFTHKIPEKLEPGRTGMLVSHTDLDQQPKAQFAVIYAKSVDTSGLSGMTKEVFLDKKVSNEMHNKV